MTGPDRMPLPAYILHRARYATAYRVGLPALEVACRILPTRTVVRIGRHYARRGKYAEAPHRYGVVHHRRDGWRHAVGVDRFDMVTDAEGVAWWTLQRRARRAAHRLDVAVAAAEGRPIPR